MTSKQIEIEASRIRRLWIDPTARARDEWDARAWNSGLARSTNTTNMTAAEKLKASLNRPLGQADLPMLTALTLDEWGPAWLTKTREQRRLRKRLERFMRSPDLSGHDSPTTEEWSEFPDLKAQFEETLREREHSRR